MAEEKLITTTALIDKFKQALAEKWGYIWGTAGETWTAARQANLEKTTDADRANSRKYGSKWIGHTVADCSGLFSWAFKQLGGYMYHGSDTMYRKYCTEHGELKKGKRTDRGTLKPGTAVFVWNGKTYSHVGLYTGDNTVIEAMSTLNGVTTSKVTAGKWTHWGELKGVDYSDAPEDKPATPTDPVLRRGNKGADVKTLHTLLVEKGYSVGSCRIDGDFGSATLKAVKAFQKDNNLTVDGVVGAKTWAALKKASAKSFDVLVENVDRATADDVVRRFGGKIIERGV